MRLILLGAGPGIPLRDKNLASIYVESEGTNLLLDCGEGCAKKLLSYGFSKDHLDCVIITHYHPDHVTGIFMLLQMLYLEGRTKPLRIFVPERPEFIFDTMHAMYTFETKFPFDLHIHTHDRITEFFPMICAHDTDHLLGYEPNIRQTGAKNLMKSSALRIRGEHGDLVYTADIATTDCIAGLISGAGTVIVDSLHPSADQVLKLRDYGIGKVLLNHGISAELEAALREHPDPLFEIAREDHEYQL